MPSFNKKLNMALLAEMPLDYRYEYNPDDTAENPDVANHHENFLDAPQEERDIFYAAWNKYRDSKKIIPRDRRVLKHPKTKRTLEKKFSTSKHNWRVVIHTRENQPKPEPGVITVSLKHQLVKTQ